MPFSRLLKFAATQTGTTVITSTVVLVAAAGSMVDNHIDRNRKHRETNKRFDGMDKRFGGVGGEHRDLNKKIDTLDTRLGARLNDGFYTVEECVMRTMRALDGDNEPLHEIIKGYDNFIEMKRKGPSCEPVEGQEK